MTSTKRVDLDAIALALNEGCTDPSDVADLIDEARRSREALKHAGPLAAAIRQFTVEAPNDEPNVKALRIAAEGYFGGDFRAPAKGRVSDEEPFGGRYWGIFSVEGDDPSPLMLIRGEVDAREELARRQALDSEHDDYLDEYHDVFRSDIVGSWWNSIDPDPRAADPLTLDEIVKVHA